MFAKLQKRVRFILFLTLAFTACQPSLIADSATAEKLTPLPPEALTVTPEFLSPLPPGMESVTTPSSGLAPLHLELDSITPEMSDLQAYRLTLNLRAWDTPEASRVRMHLPTGASVRKVLAAGWRCEKSLKQDDLLPGEHLDTDCQNLTTSRTPPAILIILFDLPPTDDPVLACAQVALKDAFEAPLCVEASFQP